MLTSVASISCKTPYPTEQAACSLHDLRLADSNMSTLGLRRMPSFNGAIPLEKRLPSSNRNARARLTTVLGTRSLIDLRLRQRGMNTLVFYFVLNGTASFLTKSIRSEITTHRVRFGTVSPLGPWKRVSLLLGC